MTEQPLEKKTVRALGRRMAYHERGTGAPILFLHGNPTSSYIWRNVIPALEGQGRLIALDLIGMGDSEKLSEVTPDTYRLTTHRDYLKTFIDAVIGSDEEILFVGHDWGAVLAFDWANHHAIVSAASPTWRQSSSRSHRLTKGASWDRRSWPFVRAKARS
jgi:haloalkane dehalogenase